MESIHSEPASQYSLGERDSIILITSTVSRHRWEENSVAACTRMCSRAGFSYSGVEWGSECFCGHEAPPQQYRQDTSNITTNKGLKSSSDCLFTE